MGLPRLFAEDLRVAEGGLRFAAFNGGTHTLLGPWLFVRTAGPPLTSAAVKSVRLPSTFQQHCAAGYLVSVDSYMNLQLASTEEYIDGQFTGNLGEVLIRCADSEPSLGPSPYLMWASSGLPSSKRRPAPFDADATTCCTCEEHQRSKKAVDAR
jgi:hypothetical protein